jgi:excisionase family DNA binding protein
MDQQGAPLLDEIPAVGLSLGIGRSKVYELIGAGVIPTVTIGRRRLVPHAALVAYVERLVAEQADPQSAA